MLEPKNNDRFLYSKMSAKKCPNLSGSTVPIKNVNIRGLSLIRYRSYRNSLFPTSGFICAVWSVVGLGLLRKLLFLCIFIFLGMPEHPSLFTRVFCGVLHVSPSRSL